MNDQVSREVIEAVAHDLRTPLACLQGYAQLLLETDASLDTRDAYARRVISCSRWAAALVSDLLDATGVERGQFPLHKETLDLGGLLSEAVSAFEILCRERGVRLSLEVGAGPCRVYADASRLRQVLNNLLSNALKHVRGEEGTILVRLATSGSIALVEVADNGSGIEPEHISRVWEKYYRGSNGNGGKQSLGLGLYIARAIVEAHGGRIWAESGGPGTGAAFRFTLPRFDAETTYSEFREARSAPTPPPRPARLS